MLRTIISALTGGALKPALAGAAVAWGSKVAADTVAEATAALQAAEARIKELDAAMAERGSLLTAMAVDLVLSGAVDPAAVQRARDLGWTPGQAGDTPPTVFTDPPTAFTEPAGDLVGAPSTNGKGVQPLAADAFPPADVDAGA